ncbi:MAG: linear amide C-N hydrolase [Eubacteriales bacterium]|nr:linear amide C-N hydrolase [Eubacteriales bacterium]
MDFGCPSFSWDTLDNKHLLGRTYDQYGDLKANKVIVVPKNAVCKTVLEKTENHIYSGKHAYTGMAVLGLEEPVIVDGVNDNGLMGALLHFPGYAEYPEEIQEGKVIVHPGRFLAYVLSQYDSVSDMCSNISDIEIKDELIMGQPTQAHYIISDGTGEAVIIEPVNGKLNIYRNSTGVMANSPDYSWHKTNLRNYVGVNNLGHNPREVNGLLINEFGAGIGGGFGLPGGYASPDRFIRMSFVKEFAVKGKNEINGISRMFKAFAPVDIPQGLIKAHPDHEAYEMTLCMTAMCAESKTYYYTPAENRRIKAIRLEEKMNTDKILTFDIGETEDILYL